ncbi:hypothetical protein BDK51DRAFT_44489 [Blyttiomyces helicus]|uniref:Uncharacterized protein n=1 Tax=Blyttiomyces helicus TaxID=388810 RepID=A0A4P9WDF2_9FUNG|nr:hypothetical protein BDK51DRAFT_44489 [Blyttiomyces helicus]|eukprot:RKO90729.1 hypothetical protein BDK51DRAFT_44489 [Blyttiomyces helicus]
MARNKAAAVHPVVDDTGQCDDDFKAADARKARWAADWELFARQLIGDWGCGARGYFPCRSTSITTVTTSTMTLPGKLSVLVTQMIAFGISALILAIAILASGIYGTDPFWSVSSFASIMSLIKALHLYLPIMLVENHKNTIRALQLYVLAMASIVGIYILLSWRTRSLSARPGSRDAWFSINVIGYWFLLLIAIVASEPEESDIGENMEDAVEQGSRKAAARARWRVRLVSAGRAVVSTTIQTIVACLVNWFSMIILLCRALLIDNGYSTAALLITLAWTPARFDHLDLKLHYKKEGRSGHFPVFSSKAFFELRITHLYAWLFLYFGGRGWALAKSVVYSLTHGRKDVEYFMALSTPSWTWFLLSLASVLGSEFFSSCWTLLRRRASFQAYHKSLEALRSVSTPHTGAISQTRSIVREKSGKVTPAGLPYRLQTITATDIESDRRFAVRPGAVEQVGAATSSPAAAIAMAMVAVSDTAPTTAPTAAAAAAAAEVETALMDTHGTHARVNRFRFASKMAAALTACSWYAAFCSTEVLEYVTATGNPEASLIFQSPGTYPEETSWNEVLLRRVFYHLRRTPGMRETN